MYKIKMCCIDLFLQVENYRYGTVQSNIPENDTLVTQLERDPVIGTFFILIPFS